MRYSHLYTHLNIKAHVLVSLMMRRVQFRDELIPLHTRVLSQCTWQCLKSFSKLFNGILLQTWTGLETGGKTRRHVTATKQSLM